MPKLIDLVGRKYGRLTVKEIAESHGKARWLCECDCGNTVIVVGSNLKSGNTVSCGCYRLLHGLSKTPTYVSWQAMINRCFNPTHPKYHLYGGRGIKPCEFFRASPLNLLLVLKERPEGRFTLDRINSDRGYTCGQCAECLAKGLALNVKWATYKEQNRNRKSVIMIGDISLAELSERAQVNHDTVYERYKRGIRGEALFYGRST